MHKKLIFFITVSLFFIFTSCSDTFTVTPSGTHVTIESSVAQNVVPGSTTSFTVTADNGYTLSSTVEGTCTSGGWASDIYTTGVITSDCTVTFSASIQIPLKIFVTASSWDAKLGQGGSAITLAAIDALCMADSNKPTDGGTYKAMFATAGAGQVRTACTTSSCSTGAGENVNWVMKPNTNYYRTDGTTLIGTTNSGGVFPLDNGQSLSNSISGVDESYWTGFEGYAESGGDGTWLTSIYKCTNWTSTGGFGKKGHGTGTTGIADNDDGAIASWQASCSTSLKLVCVEQ